MATDDDSTKLRRIDPTTTVRISHFNFVTGTEEIITDLAGARLLGFADLVGVDRTQSVTVIGLEFVSERSVEVFSATVQGKVLVELKPFVVSVDDAGAIRVRPATG